MTYRVRRGEQDLGVFELGELRQRRDSGEFTGAELVRRDGFASWQPLESVLSQGDQGAVPPPLPQSAGPGEGNPTKVYLLVGVIVVAIGAVTYLVGLRIGNHPPLAPPATGVELASKPVSPAHTPTVTDFKKRNRDFSRRQWLEGYQARGKRNPASNAEIEKFIEVSIDRRFDGPRSDDPLSLPTESIRLAQDPSCTDPLALTVAADYTLNWYGRVNLLKRALAAYPGSGHRAYPAFFANVQLMAESKYKYDQEGELNTAALKLLSQCFADGSFVPGDQQEISEILVAGYGQGFFKLNDAAVCDIVHQQGDAYHWLSLVLDGDRHIVEAWKARGGGYSNSVSADGWEGFNQNLAGARTCLTQAWTLQPTFPLAPSLMISVSMGDSGLEAMRTWFDRTLAAQVDYPGAWNSMRWGLRPRWYGSQAALLALGKEALDTGRFDTDVPRKLFDCVSDVESEAGVPAGRHIYGRPDIWPGLQRMYEGYIAEPSQEHSRKGWRTSYAAVSFFAGKYDVTRQQLEALDWTLLPASTLSWGTDLSSMPLEVAARTGPQGARVASAESARLGGRLDEALRLYSALAAEPASDARSNQFVVLRRDGLTNEFHLKEGKWVSLLPTSDHDPNWVDSFGDPHRTPDGALEVTFGPKGHMLFSKVPVGSNFEVRGRFDNVRSSSTNFQAGIVMGLPDFEGYNWYAFRMKRHDVEGDVVCFGLGWTLKEIVQHVTLNSTSNTFDFVFKDGRVSATVNDEEIFSEAVPPAAINVAEGAYLVGLGGFSDSADEVVRYRDVEVRQLH